MLFIDAPLSLSLATSGNAHLSVKVTQRKVTVNAALGRCEQDMEAAGYADSRTLIAI